MNCGIVVAVLLASAGQMGEEFYQDFRRGSGVHPALSLFGPNATQVTSGEAQGLRITLPANRPDKAAVGVSPRFAISGDFEITVGYEILSADEPPSGLGAGVGVWGQIRSDPPQAMSVACLQRPEKGTGFVAQFAHERTPDGKRDFKQKLLASGAAKKGRLRLARTGSDLSFLVAEGESDTFEELHRVSVRPDDVKPLRITASTNNAACGVSIRLVDLRIRADQLPGAARPAETGGWRVWLVAFLLVIAVGVTGGFLLWRYRPWEQRGRRGSRR
jgi:hypothetical protein